MKILNKKLVEEASNKHWDENLVPLGEHFKAGVDWAESQMIDTFTLFVSQLPKDVKFTNEFELGVHQTWGSRAIECYDFCKFVHEFLKQRNEE